MTQNAVVTLARSAEEIGTGTVYLLQKIEALETNIEEGEDEDFIHSTPYAFEKAKEWIGQCDFLLNHRLPAGHVSETGSGGLRMDWRNGEAELTLVIPSRPNGRGYIYYQRGDVSGVEKELNATNIAKWQQWLQPL